jgi:hypothetical protein
MISMSSSTPAWVPQTLLSDQARQGRLANLPRAQQPDDGVSPQGGTHRPLVGVAKEYLAHTLKFEC